MGEVFHAPCDVVLSNADVVQPDLLFVFPQASAPAAGRRECARGAGLGRRDPVHRHRRTGPDAQTRPVRKHGVQEYWLVDPDAWTVAVLRLHAGAFAAVAIYGEGQTMTSPTLAGFSTDLNEIFGRC